MLPTWRILWWLVHVLAVFIGLFWVMTDAEKRGQSGCLPALMILFFGLPGIIVWLVIRDNYQPNLTPGKLLCQNLTSDYILLTQKVIDDTEFQRRKDASIRKLQFGSGQQRPTDFFGEVTAFIDNGVLSTDDIEHIEDLLKRKTNHTEEQKLVTEFIRTRCPELQKELRRRELPEQPQDLLGRLADADLIELYQNTKELLYADELKQRDLAKFL